VTGRLIGAKYVIDSSYLIIFTKTKEILAACSRITKLNSKWEKLRETFLRLYNLQSYWCCWAIFSSAISRLYASLFQ